MSASNDQGRFRRAAALAVAGHLLGLFLIARSAPPARVPVLQHGLDGLRSQEISVELGAPKDAQPASPSNAVALRVAPARTRLRPGSVTPAEPAEEAGAASVELTPVAPGPEPERGAQPAPARPSLDALGLGNENPLLRERPKAPDRKHAADERVARSLAGGLAEHDRSLGLGADGPVLSALERATYGSALPGNVSALFLARIDEKGHLALLEVLESTGDFHGWSKVAVRALGTLTRRRLRVPQGAHGLRLSIRVSSREVLPSGADPGLEFRLFGVPLQKGRGKRSAKISVLEPYAKFDWVEIPMPGGVTAPLPSLGAGINLLGVSGDPSDIGAHPRRVVHANVEQQELL
jgi:hypothetical protein